MSEISIHSVFSNFQHYIMDFFLVLSYILYWDFSYSHIYIWVCSCSPLSLHVASCLLSYYLRSYIYILTNVVRINRTHLEKQIKWYKKFFFHIVDMASVNGLYLYKTQNSKNLHLKEFRLQLIKNIISNYNNQKTNFCWETIN